MPVSAIRAFSITGFIVLFSCTANSQDVFGPPGGAPPAAPATRPAPMEHIKVDLKAKTIRIDCQTLNPQMPLEFFCVLTGTSEHESVLRTQAKPSDIHLALLMLGLKPGSPVTYVEAAKKWIPPHGPPLHISVEMKQGDKVVTLPANRLMRNVKTKKAMPATTWIFAGSRIMEDGTYAADATGYIVSVVNFDLTLIDIPELASSSNELLEWEYDPDIVPKSGTPVTMIIEPAGKDEPVAKGAAPAQAPTTIGPARDDPSAVRVDEQRLRELRAKWDKVMGPQKASLKDAAQTHYAVIKELRQEQERLIHEADRVQRMIDQLEKEYQDLTAPRP